MFPVITPEPFISVNMLRHVTASLWAGFY